jgi:predicted membrane channel-forming protein YqfA (hemolysin III family)
LNQIAGGETMGELLQPWHLLVVGFISCIFLIPAILYILTLQRALNKCAGSARTMQPGQVWLLLIPFFNVIWHFLVVMGIAKSLRNEFARRGIPNADPLPGQSIGMAMCICACCGIIPILGIIASLASLVLWIIYWIKVAGYSELLGATVPAVSMPPTV